MKIYTKCICKLDEFPCFYIPSPSLYFHNNGVTVPAHPASQVTLG